MYPILLDLGFFVIPAWHTMFVLGVLTAYWTLLRLARKNHELSEIPTSDFQKLFLASYVPGYFGARGFDIVMTQGLHANFFGELFSVGGMVLYGGLLAGTLGGVIYVLVCGLPWRSILDCIGPGILFGIFWGRIGCFLNGDDYGIPVADSLDFLGIVLPNLEDGVLRYPVQIFESVGSGLFGFLLCRLAVRGLTMRPGTIGALSIGGYALLRFGLEYLRGDDRGWVVDGLISPAQAISFCLFVFAVYLVFGANASKTSPLE